MAESKPITAPAALAADPIFELIGLFKGAAAAHDAAIEGGYAVEQSKNLKSKSLGVDLVATTSDCRRTVMDRICTTRPTTLAGIAAMAELMARSDQVCPNDDQMVVAFKSIARACRVLKASPG